jgi:flavin-dependent dehydrogenase
MEPRDIPLKTLNYDVIILGAGLAGLCQARHLLLNIPGIRIALVDYRSEKRENVKHDYKVGEASVELSGLWLSMDLGLGDYVQEHHAPKYGLHFHWAKEVGKTSNLRDDYYSIWTCQQGRVFTPLLHRAKFERDVLQMVIKDGAHFHRGWIKEVDLGTTKAVTVALVDEQGEFTSSKIQLTASHLIDAAGRRCIVGGLTNNILKGPENVMGVNNGSAWLRVKGFDLSHMDLSYHPQQTMGSQYYATNHFLGFAHWLWCIPIETRGERELSIGVIFHYPYMKFEDFNSSEKFLAFLKANHTVLYNVVTSGQILDFQARHKLAYTSKTYLSPDNWYVIGDAAAIYDAFYSTGMVMMAFQTLSVTEVIKEKLHGDPALAEKKRAGYDKVVRGISRTANHIVSHHPKQLGNASLMSWRIFFEATLNFGVTIPVYLGKYFLCPVAAHHVAARLEKMLEFREELYTFFDSLADRPGPPVNIGMRNPYWGGFVFGGWCPTNSWDYDNIITEQKYEHKRLNMSKSIYHTFFYLGWILLQLKWQVGGLSAVLAPTNVSWLGWLWKNSALGYYNSIKFSIAHWGVPASSWRARLADEFRSYQYQPKVIEWKDTDVKAAEKLSNMDADNDLVS